MTLTPPAITTSPGGRRNAVCSTARPSALALTRQNLAQARLADAGENLTAKGGYVLRAAEAPEKVCLIATGSEVEIALKAREALEAEGIGARVVSLPSFELFEEQTPAYRADVKAGKWQRSSTFCCLDHPIHDLRDTTLAILGRGSLGSGVARLAEAFGMRVIWGERKGATVVRPGYVDFMEMLATADAVSLHCPLNEQTRGMIGEAELRTMKRDAVLINTARGPVVDLDAVTQALRDGHLAGAAIDVFDPEPPPDPARFLGVPGLLLTPHIAGVSAQSNTRVSDLIASRVLEALG
jgi:hypothetical protein